MYPLNYRLISAKFRLRAKIRRMMKKRKREKRKLPFKKQRMKKKSMNFYRKQYHRVKEEL
jgi:hypothetical protein